MPLRRTRSQRRPSILPQQLHNLAILRHSQTLLPQRQCTRMDLCFGFSHLGRVEAGVARCTDDISDRPGLPCARKRAGQLVFIHAEGDGRLMQHSKALILR